MVANDIKISEIEKQKLSEYRKRSYKMQKKKQKNKMFYITKKRLKGALTFSTRKYSNLFLFIRKFFFKKRLYKNFKQIRSVLE